MRVYLSGRVEGLKDKGQSWRQIYSERLRSTSHLIEPINSVENEPQNANSSEIVKYDAYLIQDCDCLLVNANIQFSMGTPIEMAIAKYYNKLVISIVGDESPYYKKTYKVGLNNRLDWTHPFLVAFSDHIVKNLEEASVILKEYVKNIRKTSPKTLDMILK